MSGPEDDVIAEHLFIPQARSILLSPANALSLAKVETAGKQTTYKSNNENADDPIQDRRSYNRL